MFAEETWADAHRNYEPGEDEADEYERDPDGGIADRIGTSIKAVIVGGEDRKSTRLNSSHWE